MANLLEANLERAQPVWSCPPFRKKSTWPMGMEMPKSVVGGGRGGKGGGGVSVFAPIAAGQLFQRQCSSQT